MEVDSPKKKRKKEAHIPYHKNGTKQTNMLWVIQTKNKYSSPIKKNCET